MHLATKVCRCRAFSDKTSVANVNFVQSVCRYCQRLSTQYVANVGPLSLVMLSETPKNLVFNACKQKFDDLQCVTTPPTSRELHAWPETFFRVFVRPTSRLSDIFSAAH